MLSFPLSQEGLAYFPKPFIISALQAGTGQDRLQTHGQRTARAFILCQGGSHPKSGLVGFRCRSFVP